MVRTTTAVNQVMGPVEWGLLLVLALLWGGSFFFSKIAVGELPPLTIVLCRVALAALALNSMAVLGGQRMPVDRRLCGAFLVMGLLNNVIPFSLIFWGKPRSPRGWTQFSTPRRLSSPSWLRTWRRTTKSSPPRDCLGCLPGLWVLR